MKNNHWPKHMYLVSSEAGAENMGTCSADSMGSKAYNLMRMAQIGLNVPPALVLGTHFTRHPQQCLDPLFKFGLPALEKRCSKTLGDSRNPLLVSVRSGAPVSMPGMMETLLNIGLCDATLGGFLRLSGNPRLVWDCYRRLVASYGEVVQGLPASLFEAEIDNATQGRDERLLDFSELRDLTRRFQSVYQLHAGKPFPQDVQAQLSAAIQAVFASWQGDKAKSYRELKQIDEAMGTAVTVQAMVFGNTGGHSGAGVGFTRDPTTGEPQLWIDFLANAQGEDVVSGRRNAHGHQALENVAPYAWRALQTSTQALEAEFKDMQDFEFTVQDGVLSLLQARDGKRSSLAAARIALDLYDEGLIDKATTLQRTEALIAADLGTVRVVREDGAVSAPLAQANAANHGVATGEIVLDAERAALRAINGAKLVLVRQDAQTSDIVALESSVGLLTQRGARTSHAAVVARQLGKVCLVGCETLRVDMDTRTVHFGDTILREGDLLTLDGNEGLVYAGEVLAVLQGDTALQDRLTQLRPQAHGHTKHTKHGKHRQ